MVLKEKLKQLTDEKGNLCVTISLNTHRTHPENAQDEILLKNLIKQSIQIITLIVCTFLFPTLLLK